MFAINSRFDSLLEDVKEKQQSKKHKKVQKNTKSEKPENKSVVLEKNKNIDNLFTKRSTTSLVVNELNFPELSPVVPVAVSELDITIGTTEEKQNNATTFIDVIKHKKIEETANDEIEEKEGWIILKKNKRYVSKEDDMSETENDIHPSIVFEKLARLYEKRRNEYIENWGFDNYEKYFVCNPKYDCYDDYCYYSEFFDEIEQEESTIDLHIEE
jgi:hypothetical protein